MLAYIGRRLLATLPVMAVVAVFVFSMLRLTPGDPAAIIAGAAATCRIWLKSGFPLVTATAPTHMAVTRTVAVATFDLNDSCIGAAKSTRAAKASAAGAR